MTNSIREAQWAAPILLAAIVGALALFALPTPAVGDDPFLRRTAAVAAVERVGPSVVSITTERMVDWKNPFRTAPGTPFERFFQDFYGPQSRETVQNLGSGVIIDAEGHILTNDHVIARASRIRVALADGREFDAEVVGADPNNDLAVLRVGPIQGLPWTVPGDSSDVLVGEPVIAIGNPFGLSNTVTTGVLSAVERSIRSGNSSYHGLFQTDASINPGNSGGPLLNADGTLIGINTAIYNGAQGIGFAIPINAAKRVVAELIEHGEIPPVWLGLGFQELDPALHEVMELPEGLFGVLVTDVADGSPADKAGMRRGDIMTRLDGRPLHSIPDFFSMLKSAVASQKMEFEIWRDSQVLDLRVIAEEIPDQIFEELSEQYLGMKLKQHRRGGFKVVHVRRESPASRIGIQSGDLLLGINGRPLASEADLRRSLLALRGRNRALIVVQRKGGQYHITLPLS